MTINYKRTIGGALLTAAIAGGIALTAIAPASAATVDTADSTRTESVAGTQANPAPEDPAAAPTGEVMPMDVRPGVPDGTSDGVNYTVTHTGILNSVSVSCAPGNYGSYGRSETVANAVITYTFDTPVHSTVIHQNGASGGPEFRVATNSASADFAGSPGMTRVDASTAQFGVALGNGDNANYAMTITDTSGAGFTTITFTQQIAHAGMCLSAPSAIVTAVVDCTAGLTGSVSNISHPARTASLSGKGAAGETVTITGAPGGPVTAVVNEAGNWTATVTGLTDGDNALTVSSSDNCAPVELSVLIDPLQVPIMAPAAAAGAAVLGLGAFGFGGLLRRRNTARI